MWIWLVGCDRSEGPGTREDAPPDTTPAPEVPFCEANGFGRTVPWNDEGPYGVVRHTLAADTALPMADGTSFSLAASWKGCESYVFLPDTLTRSDTDPRPIWSRDLRLLVDQSAKNAHYFLLASDRDGIRTATDEVARVLDGMDESERGWWTERLHVVNRPIPDVPGWVGEVLAGVGVIGFAVDRTQVLRGLGSLSDVTRSNPGADWPWENNLAGAALEVDRFNVEADRADVLEAADATVLPLWSGEVLSQFAEIDATLPSATEMAGYDTLELDVDMRCPDPNLPEVGNCGAWDYLAHLFVYDGDERIELGRFITTYHREAHWVLDVSPMLAHLQAGGERRFRWEWAPYWNVQPTETRLSLRLSNQGKGMRPTSAVRLATGGPFGAAYNEGREPVTVDIPATAKKVELVANITGHGAGTNQCAEFCDHEHTFTVQGNDPHLVSFPEAGTETGCVAGVADQMTPNQWGTWWFGRGGWCPGQPVIPHRVDLTDEVTPGASATLSYAGSYAGGVPPDGSGDILLESWLVVWE